jgi:outer membrane protein assembly factor BamE (lipoprotein component of BamABCDE complex)
MGVAQSNLRGSSQLEEQDSQKAPLCANWQPAVDDQGTIKAAIDDQGKVSAAADDQKTVTAAAEDQRASQRPARSE